MAHPVVAGQFLKITPVVQGLDGQVALPSVYYKAGLLTGTVTDQDFADVFDSLFGTTLTPCMNNTATYKGTLAQIVWPLPVMSRVQSVATNGPGTGGATPTPQQATPVLSWFADAAGPANRGRFYVPFPPSTAINTVTGGISNTYHVALQALADALVNTLLVGSGGNTIVVQQVIFHRDDPATSPRITSGIAERKFATQKKRGNYGKPNISPI